MEPHPEPARTLTNRQLQIFTLLCSGKTVKQVSLELRISRRTVMIHMATARERLNANTRDEALAKAVSMGLVRVEHSEKFSIER